MRHLAQDKKANCVQTCLSMLSGKNVREIETAVGGDNGINIYLIPAFCKIFNILTVKEWKETFFRYALPLNCFVVARFQDTEDLHLIIRKNGKFYDPNGTIYYKMPKRYINLRYLKIVSRRLLF